MPHPRIFLLLFLIGLLSGCGGSSVYAPVSDVSVIERIPQQGKHRVLPGETLYSIAWRYGLDYRYLAVLNHIAPPFSIKVGQVIYLKKRAAIQKIRKAASDQAVAQSFYVPEFETVIPVTYWQWPARGPIIDYYGGLNKGINIAGSLGQTIYAAAAGKVVYSNTGLRGYGKLIIIKHNNSFLTAYAHNNRVWVKEGTIVKSGQKIADMGDTGAKRVMLHFEIRRNGQPVNPLFYLNGH